MTDINSPIFWQVAPYKHIVSMVVSDIKTLNHKYQLGRTPLHLAALHSKNYKTVMALLTAGADGNIEDDHKKKPFDYVKDNPFLMSSPAYKALEDAKK